MESDPPAQKVMPDQKCPSSEEEGSTDVEMSRGVHHPHACCFDNSGYESYEEERRQAKNREAVKKNPPCVLFTNGPCHPDDFSDSDYYMEENIPPISEEEEQRWLEAERNAFISRKIQSIVQAFHYRTEKAKEKLVLPPTPSPSPPLETSSDNDQTPIHQSRPRLQSLIEDEKSSIDTRSESFNLFCCFLKKKFIPSFPQIIDPQSKLYIMWLFFVMLSYSYNAWSIIFRAVFPYQTPGNLPIFLAFDYISDLIYVLDIALFKVRLQFLHNGFWVENYKQTKANYFRKREFKLDLLSLLPLDLLYFAYGYNPLFRLPRFFKVQTFWEFFNRVDAVTKTPYVIRIIRTLMYMMYLIHLNACAYYAMSTWEGIGSNRWVFQGDGNAYIRCFYFATKTATSIGKNPKPENEIEYIFMTISWLMGVFIFAFLVGQIRDIVATATQSRTQYRQLMDQTVMYMRNLNLPDELQRRVRMWLNHNWEQQKTFNVGRILDTLPRKMKTDVAINVHYKTLVKVQLFKDCDKALLRDLVLQLRPVLFLPGDYICRKGEVGKEMYIVNKGIVEVLGGEDGDVVLATLAKGSVFGEISLLGIPGCNRRTADVRSKGFSNLFVLSKDDLWEALKNYPEAQKVLKKKAKNIIKENAARARANKPPTQESRLSTDSQREDGGGPSYTPKLVRTVLQVLPRSYHRIQPQPSTSAFTPAEWSPPRASDPSPITLTPRNTSLRNHRIQSARPPTPKTPITPSQRSMSAGALRNPPCPHEPKMTSPTKSEPGPFESDTESEDRQTSGTSSTQRMVMDSDDAISTGSSTPYLGGLFDQSSFQSTSAGIQLMDLKPSLNKSSSSSNSSSIGGIPKDIKDLGPSKTSGSTHSLYDVQPKDANLVDLGPSKGSSSSNSPLIGGLPKGIKDLGPSKTSGSTKSLHDVQHKDAKLVDLGPSKSSSSSNSSLIGGLPKGIKDLGSSKTSGSSNSLHDVQSKDAKLVDLGPSKSSSSSNSSSIGGLPTDIKDLGPSKTSGSTNSLCNVQSKDAKLVDLGPSKSSGSSSSLYGVQSKDLDQIKSSGSSNSSSILYLGGLFHHGGSTQSFNSSSKDLSREDVEDGDSTNGSSSAGYDNLAFVPSGILSRRSSIFSDISG